VCWGCSSLGWFTLLLLSSGCGRGDRQVVKNVFWCAGGAGPWAGERGLCGRAGGDGQLGDGDAGGGARGRARTARRRRRWRPPPRRSSSATSTPPQAWCSTSPGGATSALAEVNKVSQVRRLLPPSLLLPPPLHEPPLETPSLHSPPLVELLSEAGQGPPCPGWVVSGLPLALSLPISTTYKHYL